MAISYPLTFPTNKSAAKVTLGLQSAVTISSSPTTFVSQVQAFNGQRWVLGWSCPLMTRADAELFQTFLLQLNGQQGTFLIGDPSAKSPQGVATGTPLVKGASQTGQTLLTDGWTINKTPIVKAGDYIQIGQRLYKILNDANSNGSGDATLDIIPRLRESPADNAAIITANTVGLFRLSSNDVVFAEVTADKLYSISFNAVEAI